MTMLVPDQAIKRFNKIIIRNLSMNTRKVSAVHMTKDWKTVYNNYMQEE